MANLVGDHRQRRSSTCATSSGLRVSFSGRENVFRPRTVSANALCAVARVIDREEHLVGDGCGERCGSDAGVVRHCAASPPTRAREKLRQLLGDVPQVQEHVREGVVDLVRDAGRERAERREPIGLREARLDLAVLALDEQPIDGRDERVVVDGLLQVRLGVDRRGLGRRVRAEREHRDASRAPGRPSGRRGTASRP